MTKERKDDGTLEANVNNGRWTDEEHHKFEEALKLYGKDWNLI